jgi:hypothetical protein
MWFRPRRRRQPPPVLLPALDRLGELISHVVELLEQLPRGREAQPATPEEEQAPAAEEVTVAATGWIAFVPSPEGYRLVGREGSAPGCRAELELDGAPFRVARLGPSPLPGDRRRCAFLEREEPPAPERTFDR